MEADLKNRTKDSESRKYKPPSLYSLVDAEELQFAWSLI